MFEFLGIRTIAFVGVAVPAMALLYKDGPPVGHTGGFNEPSCHSCHFEGPLDSPEASLDLLNIPLSYAADSTYLLGIRLSRHDLRAGGFSMSGRFQDGRQAGLFEPIDDRTMVRLDSNQVQFAMHTLNGIRPTATDSVSWKLTWVAPSSGDTVYFHVAANAANGDDSPFGDLIKTTSMQVPAALR